jgi:cytochrome c oxidase cbb3-type subunit 3
MSSRFRRNRLTRLAPLVAAALCVAGCDQQRARVADLPISQGGPGNVAVSGLFPGGGSRPPEDPRGKLYEGNPHAVAEGKRLFEWYNCVGCHFHGAGGIGPPLLDHAWRYGSRIDEIYASIYQGRPNGMPTWGGKIPDAEMWEIAAYIRWLATTGSEAPVPKEKPLPVTVPQTNPEPSGQQPKPPPQ